jgi:hypothetical protein
MVVLPIVWLCIGFRPIATNNRLRASCDGPAHGAFPHPAKTRIGADSMSARAANDCSRNQN